MVTFPTKFGRLFLSQIQPVNLLEGVSTYGVSTLI